MNLIKLAIMQPILLNSIPHSMNKTLITKEELNRALINHKENLVSRKEWSGHNF